MRSWQQTRGAWQSCWTPTRWVWCSVVASHASNCLRSAAGLWQELATYAGRLAKLLDAYQVGCGCCLLFCNRLQKFNSYMFARFTVSSYKLAALVALGTR